MQRENTNLLIGSAIGLIFGPIFFDLSHLFYKKLKRYRLYKNNGVKTVSQLHKQVKSSPESFKYKNSRFKTLSVFVEGRLISDQPVYMITVPNTLVNYSKREKSKLFQNHKYLDSPFYMTQDFSYNLYIHDPTHYNLKMPLHMDFQKELSSLSNVAIEKFDYHDQNALKRLLLLMNRLVLKLFNGLLNWKLSGFEIGTRDREYVVALNAPVFMFAKVYLDKETGAISIRAAKFISGSLTELLGHIYDVKATQVIVWGISGAITALTFRSILRILYTKYKRQSLVKKLHQALSGNNALDDTIVMDSISCATCLSKPRNAMLNPCRHVRHCSDCYHKWRAEGNNKCEICGKNVIGKVDLFFS